MGFAFCVRNNLPKYVSIAKTVKQCTCRVLFIEYERTHFSAALILSYSKFEPPASFLWASYPKPALYTSECFSQLLSSTLSFLYRLIKSFDHHLSESLNHRPLYSTFLRVHSSLSLTSYQSPCQSLINLPPLHSPRTPKLSTFPSPPFPQSPLPSSRHFPCKLVHPPQLRTPPPSTPPPPLPSKTFLRGSWPPLSTNHPLCLFICPLPPMNWSDRAEKYASTVHSFPPKYAATRPGPALKSTHRAPLCTTPSRAIAGNNGPRSSSPPLTSMYREFNTCNNPSYHSDTFQKR
jgi:hypothetical protein